VGLPGVRARPQGVADDGVLIDAGQAGGLADTAAVLEVLKDGQGAVLGQAGAEQGGALALAEALLAGAAGEHAVAAALAVTEGDAQVASATQAVVGTLGVLAAESVKVFHERNRTARTSKHWTTPGWNCRKAVQERQRYGDTTQQ
jgi:hypothetical protein